MTTLARQVGEAFARTRERTRRVIFIIIFFIDGSIARGAQEEAWCYSSPVDLKGPVACSHRHRGVYDDAQGCGRYGGRG